MSDFDETFHHLLKVEVTSLLDKGKEMIQNLTELGDVHENERPVQHKVIFTSEEDMEAFKNEIINKGFVITKGEDELELIVLHISPIKEEKLFANFLYLADVAKANNGTYIGWESKALF